MDVFLGYIAYLFSFKKILWTLIINFVVSEYFYYLITQGVDSFYLSPAWLSVVTIFVIGIDVIYFILSYNEFKIK